MSARSKAREMALKALYACEIGEGTPDEAFGSLADPQKLNAETRAFARELFDVVLAERERLDTELAKLAVNWSLERMAPIDKNIIQISMAELSCFPDIPKKVSINEAVELAKRYGSSESPKFVNGVLDRYARSVD